MAFCDKLEYTLNYGTAYFWSVNLKKCRFYTIDDTLYINMKIEFQQRASKTLLDSIFRLSAKIILKVWASKFFNS